VSLFSGGITPTPSIEYCHSCKKRVTKNKLQAASTEMWSFQKELLYSFSQGRAYIANREIASYAFLDGIRALCTGVARIRKNKELLNCKKILFELSDIHLRYELLNECRELLINWPVNFQLYCKDNRKVYSNFFTRSRDKTVPDWVKTSIKSP